MIAMAMGRVIEDWQGDARIRDQVTAFTKRYNKLRRLVYRQFYKNPPLMKRFRDNANGSHSRHRVWTGNNPKVEVLLKEDDDVRVESEWNHFRRLCANQVIELNKVARERLDQIVADALGQDSISPEEAVKKLTPSIDAVKIAFLTELDYLTAPFEVINELVTDSLRTIAQKGSARASKTSNAITISSSIPHMPPFDPPKWFKKYWLWGLLFALIILLIWWPCSCGNPCEDGRRKRLVRRAHRPNHSNHHIGSVSIGNQSSDIRLHDSIKQSIYPSPPCYDPYNLQSPPGSPPPPYRN